MLDPDASAAFAQRNGLADAGPASMSADRPVRAEVGAGVERANAHLSRIEQIKRFKILRAMATGRR